MKRSKFTFCIFDFIDLNLRQRVMFTVRYLSNQGC